MSNKETLEEQKANLVNDLIAVTTVLEELWNYHPDNSEKKDVVAEYNQLLKIQGDIENELKSLE
ncbi:hypothetical protein N9Z41_01060 [bacterium]|nr:hypothetical protein [bacterium]